MGYRCGSPLALILAIGSIDWVWGRRVGLGIEGWTATITAVAFCLLIAVFYSRVRAAPRLAEMAGYAALWICFTSLGCILTYLAASVSRPFADTAFIAFDTRLGFNWVDWANFIHQHPALRDALRVCYGSLIPQISGSLILFALAGVSGRNEELLMHAVTALLVTSFVAMMMPALGPWVQFSYGETETTDTLYVADVLRLRSGPAATFMLARMQGIICFPSYHTVLALLLVYSHRGLRWSLPPILVINGLMLLSIPSEGGHYLADLFAGGGVAVATIAITRNALTAGLAGKHLASDIPARLLGFRARGAAGHKALG
jgi:hypothetical protein